VQWKEYTKKSKQIKGNLTLPEVLLAVLKNLAGVSNVNLPLVASNWLSLCFE
jgi:hypothetical protein